MHTHKTPSPSLPPSLYLFQSLSSCVLCHIDIYRERWCATHRKTMLYYKCSYNIAFHFILIAREAFYQTSTEMILGQQRRLRSRHVCGVDACRPFLRDTGAMWRCRTVQLDWGAHVALRSEFDKPDRGPADGIRRASLSVRGRARLETIVLRESDGTAVFILNVELRCRGHQEFSSRCGC